MSRSHDDKTSGAYSNCDARVGNGFCNMTRGHEGPHQILPPRKSLVDDAEADPFNLTERDQWAWNLGYKQASEDAAARVSATDAPRVGPLTSDVLAKFRVLVTHDARNGDGTDWGCPDCSDTISGFCDAWGAEWRDVNEAYQRLADGTTATPQVFDETHVWPDGKPPA